MLMVNGEGSERKNEANSGRQRRVRKKWAIQSFIYMFFHVR